MTPAERIAEIRKRCEAATPGPWHQAGVHGNGVIQTSHITRDVWTIANTFHAKEVDTPFIAHSREDIPWLLSQLEAVTKRNETQARTIDSIVFERDEARAEAERLQQALQNVYDLELHPAFTDQSDSPLPWKSEEK